MDYPVCPRCGNRTSAGVTQITDASGSHYICNNPKCGDKYIYEDDALNPDPDPGRKTQFRVVTDRQVRFPFNQIFVDRELEEFYQKQYVE